jgi:hypothetical protein
VDIAPLKAWLTVVFPSKVVHPVRQFCAMVALCGCDFARNLPRLGPPSSWKIRHRLQNVDLGNPTHALCGINVAYHDMFVSRNVMPTHMSNSIEWFENVSEETALTLYDAMTRKIEQDQRISQRIKQQLWPAATSSVHTRNATWTMCYWTLLEHATDPLTHDFGYLRDAKGRTSFAAEIKAISDAREHEVATQCRLIHELPPACGAVRSRASWL